MRLLLCIPALLLAVNAEAQNDPEFPKAWVLYAEGRQGVVTNFHGSSPDHYTLEFNLAPQYTVIPQHLRLGASAGITYTAKKWSGLFGPRLAWKLKTMKVEPLGSILNLQLQLEHLWGTNEQRLFGGGLQVELFQLLSLGIMAQRDYSLNAWWLRGNIGFNILHKKRKSPTGDDPFR